MEELQKQWEIAEEAIQKYMRDHMNLTEITESYKSDDKTINEKLNPTHQIFICEMGAKYPKRPQCRNSKD